MELKIHLGSCEWKKWVAVVSGACRLFLVVAGCKEGLGKKKSWSVGEQKRCSLLFGCLFVHVKMETEREMLTEGRERCFHSLFQARFVREREVNVCLLEGQVIV